MNAEQQRLAENNSPEESWHFWGPYLAERAWGTVREDYSGNGDASIAGTKMASPVFAITSNVSA